MELDQLEQSAKQLNAVLNKFPIIAVSLDDFRPIEEKVYTTRKSLMPLNARLLMLKAKYKQYVDRRSESEDEFRNTLQNVVSDTLLNVKAVKLFLHSTTILSMFNNKEGTAEDQQKLNTYMSKLFTLNDNIMTTEEAIEKASQVQLDLKIECQKAIFEHTKFLEEQEQIRSERLQKTNPEIVRTKNQLEKYIRRINIIKKLIRNFITVSNHMLKKKPILLKMLENHRELINIETIVKMSQSNEENE
ncbi:PREDICTED: uncharacterized protein LOC108759728 [Trachymyrmex cornetzi]|uniref:Uncharacterized protein n=1 Tax=Trachymyrmex cornetzi TaxID=471704 RepID=A0A151J968_9HYME|nr:PREDICTED: uncharacterized protein LOC108759728 [Trachymyrmex cornetzi]KYN21586.1 hypothetical protein ALC57_06063 [Trachymyrmex cornetzi]